MTEQLKVELGKRSYPVSVGQGLLPAICDARDAALESGKKVVFLLDEGFKNAYPMACDELVGGNLFHILPSGEKTKSISCLEQIWNFLGASKLDRSGVLFAVGGGVVGDLVGFAAATFLRGISFYQVPTTLLAMVDSSVGGKTGINLQAGKNLVGSFHQPDAVWADTSFLEHLPSREFSAGMAEVIKYGMLGDDELYRKLSRSASPLSFNCLELESVIKQCCQIKARIVATDEKETSGDGKGRALLNLGHTFAHAVEAVAGYGVYLHGEAVAIGLCCALRLSQKMNLCAGESLQELEDLLRSYSLPVELKEPLAEDLLLDAMASDKKVSHGKLRFVIMNQVGDAIQTDQVKLQDVRKVLGEVGASCGS